MQRHRPELTTAPVIVTDGFPSTVSVVTVRVSGQPWGIVSRAAAADLSKRAEIMRALSAAGISRHAIREALDGVRH